MTVSKKTCQILATSLLSRSPPPVLMSLRCNKRNKMKNFRPFSMPSLKLKQVKAVALKRFLPRILIRFIFLLQFLRPLRKHLFYRAFFKAAQENGTKTHYKFINQKEISSARVIHKCFQYDFVLHTFSMRLRVCVCVCVCVCF